MRCTIFCYLLFLLLLVLGSCRTKNHFEPDGFKTAAPGDNKPQSANEMIEAFFLNSNGEKIRVRLEVADTPEKRAKGLMFRKSLPPDQGMIFIFEVEDDHEFYMKNTYIPLDMFYVNSSKIIVAIVENTQPLSVKSIRVGKPSKYVIEMNAFFAAKNRIRSGDSVIF